MRIIGILSIIFLFFTTTATAQLNTYIVKFNDKNGTPYSLSHPEQYLSQKTVERRITFYRPIDSTDLPINPWYIDSLRLSGNVSIINSSKWLNQTAIRTTDEAALIRIQNLPFVTSVFGVAPRKQPDSGFRKQQDVVVDIPPVEARDQDLGDYYNYGKSHGQVALHNGQFLHNHGFRGQDMIMCILDAGFYHYQTLPTFDSIRQNNQILGTWDFVDNEASVNEDYSHGMQCLSTIAANLPGVFVGTAPQSDFYLFRTENVNSEYLIEEQNLAAGLERADSLGVNVCSISLGYTQFDDPSLNHTYADMNGHTTIAARAAEFAAEKGMMVVVAMGNEGTNAWHYLSTPADAEQVVSVGAVDTLGVIGSFSSYGPSASGIIKPDVAATGVYAVVANTASGLPSYGFGTSFACPNIAGLITCLWQAYPNYPPPMIKLALQTSASQFTMPNNRVGYGIPDLKKAFVFLLLQSTQRYIDFEDCHWNFSFGTYTAPDIKLTLKGKTSPGGAYQTISTKQSNEAWGHHTIDLTNDILPFKGKTFSYQVIMEIGTDTTFLLDSLTIQIPPVICSALADSALLVRPNPTHGDAELQIPIGVSSHVKIIVYSALGQRVYSLEDELGPGIRHIIIPSARLSTGVYFIRLYINNQKQKTLKFVRN